MRHDEHLEADATLFEVVRQGKMAMSSVVDDWIEAYNVSEWLINITNLSMFLRYVSWYFNWFIDIFVVGVVLLQRSTNYITSILQREIEKI